MTKKPLLDGRQGDVLLIPESHPEFKKSPIADVVAAPKDPRGVVLAEGDSTAHHHKLDGRGKLFRFTQPRTEMLVSVAAKCSVVVVGAEVNGQPRHTGIPVKRGKVLARIQRAWTSAASRPVVD